MVNCIRLAVGLNYVQFRFLISHLVSVIFQKSKEMADAIEASLRVGGT